MKLYVKNQNNQKVYLNLTASTRQELADNIGGQTFYLGEDIYYVNDVFAESNTNNMAAGAVIGGTVGALGGPIGIIIGGIIGGLFGSNTGESEISKVRIFNES